MISITRLFTYPVKSLGGIEMTESAVDRRGLRLDRRWMVVDAGGMFLTQRTLPRMARARVSVHQDYLAIEADAMPSPLTVPLVLPEDARTIDVQIWRNNCLAQPVGHGADRWLTEFLGQPSRLVYMPDSTERAVNPAYALPGEVVSFADGYPALVASESSLAELNSRLPAPISIARFRPNLVVSGAPAFDEDRWDAVSLENAAFRGTKPCERCVVTTLDPQTGDSTGPEPLRTLAQYRRGEGGAVLFGHNLTVTHPGSIRVGDAVTVTHFAESAIA